MANSKYYILNDALEDCPTWVSGQMYCAGVQLAKGYWRNQEKTRDSFITHPRTGERLYRTGDLGCYHPDGNIEFLGRVDFQIKIRGHRIEVGEIEAVLTQHPNVKAAVVAATGEQHKQQLVAYLVSDRKPNPTLEEISEFLKKKLPDYMMPSAFTFLDTLPLSANGKVDRRALLIQDSIFQKLEVAYVPPKSEVEQTIATAVKEILGLEKVGINDNFFELGGNSLLLTKIYRRLLDLLPDMVQSIALTDLFKHSTISALAKRLNPKSVSSLHESKAEAEEKIQQGKNRLQQRFQKSKLINNYRT